jgi:hypothetical protein
MHGESIGARGRAILRCAMWYPGTRHVHCVACRSKFLELARTTQNLWPVGASMTHQV